MCPPKVAGIPAGDPALAELFRPPTAPPLKPSTPHRQAPLREVSVDALAVALGRLWERRRADEEAGAAGIGQESDPFRQDRDVLSKSPAARSEPRAAGRGRSFSRPRATA